MRAELPGEVGEIVRDFIEITHAGVDAESSRGVQRERLRRAGRVRARRACSCCSRSSRARARPAAPHRDAAALEVRTGACAIMARDEFARRRRQLMRLMGRDSIAVLPAAPVRHRNSDVEYPYRQDSDFHYLTGFGEPEAVAVLVPGRAQAEYILFVRDRDPRARDLGRQARRPRRRHARLRRRRCLPDRRHRRDPARPAREPHARVLHHGRVCRTSTSAWSAG